MILGNENWEHLHYHSNAHLRLNYCTVLVLTTSSRAACMQDWRVDYNPQTELLPCGVIDPLISWVENMERNWLLHGMEHWT